MEQLEEGDTDTDYINPTSEAEEFLTEPDFPEMESEAPETEYEASEVTPDVPEAETEVSELEPEPPQIEPNIPDVEAFDEKPSSAPVEEELITEFEGSMLESERELEEETGYETEFQGEGNEEMQLEEIMAARRSLEEEEPSGPESTEGEGGDGDTIIPPSDTNYITEETEEEDYPKLPHRTEGTANLSPSEKQENDQVKTIASENHPKIFICTEEEKNRTLSMESYCCQQIKIPPLLPHILKTFTKGAIKTQPRDLLQWSAAYFRALANNEIPPVKERLEYPTVESPFGLTKGLLRVLHKQLGKNELVVESKLREKWLGICLDGGELTKLLQLNSLDHTFEWTKFVVVASASIVNDHVVEAMVVFCETMTNQPDGVEAYIPYELFAEAYTFLAEKLDVAMHIAEDVCNFLRDLAKANFELIGPKDFMAAECPPLF